MTELIPQHSRVALKNGADSVYVFALAGSEGWVRDHKKDDDEFDLVLVEWDKDHWRYNGQPDGWTFASHFKIIGDPELPVEKDDDKEEAAHEVEELLAQLSEKSDPIEEQDDVEEFMEKLSDAMEAASESEGFFMVT